MRPRPKKPRTANTMTMMRIQSQIDTVILSLGSAPTLRRVDPYLQGCSAHAANGTVRARASLTRRVRPPAPRRRSGVAPRPHFDHAQPSIPAQRDRVAALPRRYGSAERGRVGGCPVLMLELVGERHWSPLVCGWDRTAHRAY